MSLSASRAGAIAPTLQMLSHRIAALSGWRRAASGFALGAASILAFAPFHFWPLLFLTLPTFVWLLDGIADRRGTSAAKPQWREAAIAGWWFGFGFFVAGLYWVGFAFFVEADKFALLAPMGVAAFPAALAFFFALACAVAIFFWRPGVRRIFVLASALFAADWLRGNILTGFPWNLWGYALAGNDALAQSASLFGIYGLTLLALLIFLSPAALAGRSLREDARGWVLPVICLGLLALGWGWGALRLSHATDDVHPDIKLRIVQANIPQAEKWKPENRQWIFDRLRDLSKRPKEGADSADGITHLIWPETSLPFLFMINDKILYDEVRDALAELLGDGQKLIIGAERVEGTKRVDGRYNVDRIFNSLFILNANAQVLDIYDKTHLVPFGEYIPFEKTLGALGVKQLTHMNSGFASGKERRLLSAPGAPPFFPFICYEAIFPGRVPDAQSRPGWLLNLTNDAWFGTSTGPYQHMQQARVRAIEEGLPLVRSANTGISAVIDSYGRVIASLPLNEIGVIDQALPVALPPPPFARSRENFLLLVAFLIFILYRLAVKVE